MQKPGNDSSPWYREPWPWLLMAGPFTVIIAAFVTLWLAISSNDGLVAEDYYQKGLTAGETLARSHKAAALGMEAGVRLTAEGMQVRLQAAADMSFPAVVVATLSHPTRAGLDQTSRLQRGEDGVYRGQMRLPRSGHWLMLFEDEKNNWRLMGSVKLPASGEVIIGAEVRQKTSTSP